MQHEIEILLIEDNLNDADLTIRALKRNKFANKLVHLRDGAEALDFIFATGIYSDRKMEDGPKVILLDLNMPKVSGMEVLERLKSDDRTKRIPVIVLTSSNVDPDIQTCYALGANSYVVKPVEFDKFMKAVGDLGFYWKLLNQQSSE